MKGIVLAGGTGSRLWPITRSVSKQLLPVYDKPMIFYPIATLMLAGVRDILIITTPQHQEQYIDLLGSGSSYGVHFEFATQSEPRGLAEAFIIGEKFLNGEKCLMILGDNIFHGSGLGRDISSNFPNSGAHIFTYEVSNPEDYGVLELDKDGTPLSITEKPKNSKSNMAVTGIYFFDSDVTAIAKSVRPSKRGELEITSVIERYLELKTLSFTHLTRGAAWLDTGSPNSLNDAAAYVRIIEERTGLKIGCLEEVALSNNWISREDILANLSPTISNSYFDYVRRL